MPVPSTSSLESLPDIDGLSQQIANLHLQGDFFLDTPELGKHIRRVTLSQILKAPTTGSHHRLLIGGRETKFVELVANVADTEIDKDKGRVDFILDDGFGRMKAWLPLKSNTDEHFEKQLSLIQSLRPFDYAHIEGKVHKPPGEQFPIFQVISMRRLLSGWDIYLHLLQALAEIRDYDEAQEKKKSSKSVEQRKPSQEAPQTPSPPKRLPKLQTNLDVDSQSSRRIPQEISPTVESPSITKPRKGKARAALADTQTPNGPSSAKKREPSQQSPTTPLRPEPIAPSISESSKPKTRKRRVKAEDPDDNNPFVTTSAAPPAARTRSSRKGKSKDASTSPTSPSGIYQLRSPPPKAMDPNSSPALQLHPMTLGSHILRYFRFNFAAATSPEGISLEAEPGLLDYLMCDQGLKDMDVTDLREAIHYLVAKGLLCSTDELGIRYALVVG